MAVIVAPICKVPNCNHDVQISSKQGDQVRYMHTCSRHWIELIPTEIQLLLKRI